MLTAHSAAPRPAVAEPPPGSRRPRRRRLAAIWPYLLVAPTVVGTAFLLLYPLVRNTVMSFQHFGLGELIRGGATWVGFANYYRTVLDDPEFWTVVRRTLW